MREACGTDGSVHLKTILATGELPDYRSVYQSSLVCMMAGADFIKTSTGKESVNATMEVRKEGRSGDERGGAGWQGGKGLFVCLFCSFTRSFIYSCSHLFNYHSFI